MGRNCKDYEVLKGCKAVGTALQPVYHFFRWEDEETIGKIIGAYINIGNAGFQSVRNGEYVDKSWLVGFVNSKQHHCRIERYIC